MSLPPIDKEEVRRLYAAEVGVDDMARRFGPGVGRKRVIETLEELGLPRFGLGQHSSQTGRKRAVHLDPVTGLKMCSKCKDNKPEGAFRSRQTTYDGLDTQCRECRRKYSRSNYDKRSVAAAAWHDANLERVMFLNARMRARNKGLPFTITSEDIRIPDRCPLPDCERVLTCTERERGKKGTPNLSSPSLDRWDPALGYVPDNIWVICMGCNARKQNMSGEEVVAFGFQLIEAFKREKTLLSISGTGET